MKCPTCRSPKRRVVDSRHQEIGIRRRSECEKCGERFTTYEVDEVALEKMKKIGQRQAFMEICQSELNKAYFRIMEHMKKLAIEPSATDFDEDGPVPQAEVVPFHLSGREKRA